MTNPNAIDKYLYIRKTPTWKIKLFYVIGLLTWFLMIYGFSGIVMIDPFYRWFVAPILLFLTLYHTLSYSLNLFYKQFDIKKHIRKLKRFWHTQEEPTIDIFLPVCGEDISIRP